MSEIKPEVEYVIKNGRQVVEKKQVDFPDKLSAQLDAMKQQYNDLGASVQIFFKIKNFWDCLNLASFVLYQLWFWHCGIVPLCLGSINSYFLDGSSELKIDNVVTPSVHVAGNRWKGRSRKKLKTCQEIKERNCSIGRVDRSHRRNTDRTGNKERSNRPWRSTPNSGCKLFNILLHVSHVWCSCRFVVLSKLVVVIMWIFNFLCKAAKEQLDRKEPIIKTLNDILTQLGEMAEENSLSNTEIQIKDTKDKVVDLNERISQRSSDLKVNNYFANHVTKW